MRPRKEPRPNPFTRDGKILVGVVKGRNVEKMVRECVDLIGGLGRLAIRGKTVLVKPNVVAGNPPPTTTNPEVVRAVVGLLYEGGAQKVIVGDMSGLATLPTKDNLEKTGIRKAAEEAGAHVLSFDDGDWVKVELPGARHLDGIHVARPVYEADFFINLPVVKTHRMATYSICLKNLIGVTHPRYRPYRINPARWEEVVAEVNLAVHPDLNIVDATTCMVAGGPRKGLAMDTGMVLASGDRIAADVVGLAVIKSFGKWKRVSEAAVWDQRQIRHAQNLGLGITERKSLELVTRFLEGDEKEFAQLMERIKGYVVG